MSELCKYIIKHPEQFSVSWKQHHKIYPKDSFRSFIRTNESNFAQTKSLSKTFGKIATAIAFVSLAIDIGISWYDNYKNNENWISDSIVDTIYIGTRFAISWGINAVCSLIPGFGWLIGIGVSIGVDYLIQLTMENGVLDNIKNWTAKTWKSVVDGWNYFWSFDWI